MTRATPLIFREAAKGYREAVQGLGVVEYVDNAELAVKYVPFDQSNAAIIELKSLPPKIQAVAIAYDGLLAALGLPAYYRRPEESGG